MSADDLELDAGTRLDPDSQAWMDRLRCSGAERGQALARLHDLLLRAARSETARRSGSPRPGGLDLDDLARRAAADALRAITAELPGFRGESRFTTWASKVAVSAVAGQAARAAAAPGPMPADDVDDGGWGTAARPPWDPAG
jgi:DNA-directed RNA polymerase specialized sigma24 family protein